MVNSQYLTLSNREKKKKKKRCEDVIIELPKRWRENNDITQAEAEQLSKYKRHNNNFKKIKPLSFCFGGRDGLSANA